MLKYFTNHLITKLLLHYPYKMRLCVFDDVIEVKVFLLNVTLLACGNSCLHHCRHRCVPPHRRGPRHPRCRLIVCRGAGVPGEVKPHFGVLGFHCFTLFWMVATS